MRRLAMRAALVCALALSAMTLLAPERAAADGCPAGQVPQPSPYGGTICIPVEDPGDPGGSVPGTETTGTATCTYQGNKIPCVTDQGIWFSSRQCYAKPADPQPGPDDPVWGGNDPTKGKMWYCTNYQGPGTGGYWFYVSDGSTPALIDPGEVAQNALDEMPLQQPEVHLAPAPPLKTYVSLATWLWMTPGQYRRIAMTVTAGSTSVRVQAVPVRVEWEMGDGSTETCHSAGRPWVRGMPEAVQTTCSHTYETTSESEPGGKFDIAATIFYQVDWTCTGACLSTAGTLGEVPGLPGTSAIAVGERQSVVIN